MNRRETRLVTASALIAAGLTTGALAIGLGPAPAHRDMSQLPISEVAAALATPCPTEDSHTCYWDASGNGQGESFLDVLGNTFPLPIEGVCVTEPEYHPTCLP